MTDPIGRGERAPDFVLPTQTGTPTRFYGVAGGVPTVLFFTEPGHIEIVTRLVNQLESEYGERVAGILILNRSTDTELDFTGPVFIDGEGRIRAAFRLGQALTAVVLSSNLRVLAVTSPSDPLAAGREIAATIAADAPPAQVRQISEQAPVLLVPDVLDAGFCSDLIRVWHEHGHRATGVESSHAAGRSTTLDGEAKRRQDHVVGDADLTSKLTTTIGRRVLPELSRSFAYRADRFEGFKISCYDGEEAGFFRPHRDNLSPSTAHRRFALTLNLNEEYVGGCLRFPEHGPHLYRPAIGEALLFSCAHLHEVTPVESGRRFALLSFLFSGAEAEQRKRG
jgi:predicted 2-oxoglutarate/Fe(II)-dependent dioxygenase YbiX